MVPGSPSVITKTGSVHFRDANEQIRAVVAWLQNISDRPEVSTEPYTTMRIAEFAEAMLHAIGKDSPDALKSPAVANAIDRGLAEHLVAYSPLTAENPGWHLGEKLLWLSRLLEDDDFPRSGIVIQTTGDPVAVTIDGKVDMLRTLSEQLGVWINDATRIIEVDGVREGVEAVVLVRSVLQNQVDQAAVVAEFQSEAALGKFLSRIRDKAAGLALQSLQLAGAKLIAHAETREQELDNIPRKPMRIDEPSDADLRNGRHVLEAMPVKNPTRDDFAKAARNSGMKGSNAKFSKLLRMLKEAHAK